MRGFDEELGVSLLVEAAAAAATDATVAPDPGRVAALAEGMLFSCSVTAIMADMVEGTWAAVGWGDGIAGVVLGCLEIVGGAIPANAAATEMSNYTNTIYRHSNFYSVQLMRGSRAANRAQPIASLNFEQTKI